MNGLLRSVAGADPQKRPVSRGGEAGIAEPSFGHALPRPAACTAAMMIARSFGSAERAVARM